MRCAFDSPSRSEKLRKKLLGRRISPKTEFKKGRKSVSYWKGKKMPKEMKDNMSESHKGEKNYAYIDGRSKTLEYHLHYNRIRKARLKKVIGSYSFQEWENLKKQYKYTCLSCKKKEPEIKLTVDHIIPISKGGSNYIDNIQPLCAKCNSSKSAKTAGKVFNTSSLVVGAGEIGIGVFNILKDQYQTYIIDKDSKCFEPITYLHICFGYNDKFVDQVKKYQEEYQPTYTLVHSTVPVGTNRQLNSISTPCICQHPFIAEGLKTFTKMLGGEQASEVADYFRRAGMKVALFDKPETTEAAKLFLTEYYRDCINFAKRVKTYADKHGLNFHEIYTLPNEIYNEGYKKLGNEEFIRPILQPIMTPIGGHCVEPNKELIKLSE